MIPLARQRCTLLHLLAVLCPPISFFTQGVSPCVFFCFLDF
ncbi:CHLTR T2 Protein [Chlamydia pneumoniae CWL029]|uniref:CHLTR T2 Protein n=1 Tax=Chlamydia pneumoniae TaxID=83558 RepID=A0A0H2ULI8_CHLPN|nr:CHLTR T2 Protein [Chlamydia pneumoniae CWL029]BAA98542.1 CHLTR T2 protein [Chlamydia pneumoniae J138]